MGEKVAGDEGKKDRGLSVLEWESSLRGEPREKGSRERRDAGEGKAAGFLERKPGGREMGGPAPEKEREREREGLRVRERKRGWGREKQQRGVGLGIRRSGELRRRGAAARESVGGARRETGEAGNRGSQEEESERLPDRAWGESPDRGWSE